MSFHFINHRKIKSRRSHGEIMKKSWSQYQIWWKITITIRSRYQICGRGKTLFAPLLSTFVCNGFTNLVKIHAQNFCLILFHNFCSQLIFTFSLTTFVNILSSYLSFETIVYNSQLLIPSSAELAFLPLDPAN